MTRVITLEVISDIDTITLEEKIEELEALNNNQDEYIIAIAKMQLAERYKIQQFGRMLMNDQIPIISDINAFCSKPPTTNLQLSSSRPLKKKAPSFNILKKTLVQSGTTVIGKPALSNYRYEKRSNSVKCINKQKNKQQKKVCQSKKSSAHLNAKLSQKRQLPQSYRKNSEKLQIISQNNKPPSPKIFVNAQNINKQIADKQFIKNNQKIESVIIPQPKLKFIENDVYETKTLKEAQNLGDILKNLQQIDLIAQQSNQRDSIQNSTVIDINQGQLKEQEVLDNIQEKSQKERFQINELLINHEKQSNKQYFDYQQIPEEIQALEPKEQNQKKLKLRRQQDLHLDLSFNKFQSKIKEENNLSDNAKIRQETLQSEGRSFKSHSVKNMAKAILPNQITGDDVINEEIQMKEIFSQRTKIEKQNIIVPQQNLCKKKSKKFQIISTLPLYADKVHKYHQIISNFSRLFPHSKNLISDLRFIEEQLKKHSQKKVTKLSLNDEYLRIRQSQLLCQTVSQSQKAQKYQYLFDIDLKDYVYRSSKMLQRIKKQAQSPKQNQTLLYRVVRQRQDVYDIVNNCFHRTDNWFELPHGMDLKISWNLLWTWSRPQIQLRSLCYFQKVNHFFGNKEIARKDLLKKNIQRIKKIGKAAKKAFDIIPQTFYLPGENMQFIRKFHQYSKKGDKNYWILKPVGMSRGRGIQLIDRIQDVVFNEPIVLQKYLLNPLLLDGYKFDMRIYVLVTSINPLQAYIYRQGFARISTHKYSTQQTNLSDKLIHLTNFSVQKQNLGQQTVNEGNKRKKEPQSFEKKVGGCKITLKMLRQRLTKCNINWDTIQSQIQSIVLKSLIAVMNVIEPNPNCFELFGYDIIVDENLQCSLIQVNSSPSLEKDFLIDEILKQQLVDDVIEVVDPLPYDRQRLLEVVCRRRKQLEGHKSHIKTSNNSNHQLNEDIDYILHGKKIPKYGQRGEHKNFIRIAPSQGYSNLIRLVQHYRIDPIQKQY